MHTLDYAMTHHPEKNLDELVELVGVGKMRLLVAISETVKPLPLIWDQFRNGTIPIGNLVASQRLPRFGEPADHAAAASGPVDDFLKYVQNVQREAAEACKFLVLTPQEALADAIKDRLAMQMRADIAEEKLRRIHNIAADESEDW